MRKCAFTLSGSDSPLRRFLIGDDAKIVSASFSGDWPAKYDIVGETPWTLRLPRMLVRGFSRGSWLAGNGMPCRVIWVCRRSPQHIRGTCPTGGTTKLTLNDEVMRDRESPSMWCELNMDVSDEDKYKCSIDGQKHVCVCCSSHVWLTIFSSLGFGSLG